MFLDCMLLAAIIRRFFKKFPHFYIFAGNGEGGSSSNWSASFVRTPIHGQNYMICGQNCSDVTSTGKTDGMCIVTHDERKGSTIRRRYLT